MRALGARAGAAAERTGGAGGGQGERRGEGRKGALGSSLMHGRAGMATSTTRQARLPAGRCEARRSCSSSLPGFGSLLSAAWAALSGRARMGFPGCVELVCFGAGKCGWVRNLCLGEKGCREQH